MTRIYTFGVFDLFHYGHLNLLKRARRLGDELIIGVYTDKVAESFKRKPIMDEMERYLLLTDLNIGKVVFQKEYSPERNLKKYNIDIVAKAPGAGWEVGQVPEFEGVKSMLLDYTPGISTSDIIKRME